MFRAAAPLGAAVPLREMAGAMPQTLATVFLILNLVTFALLGLDKALARAGRRRVAAGGGAAVVGVGAAGRDAGGLCGAGRVPAQDAQAAVLGPPLPDRGVAGDRRRAGGRVVAGGLRLALIRRGDCRLSRAGVALAVPMHLRKGACP